MLDEPTAMALTQSSGAYCHRARRASRCSGRSLADGSVVLIAGIGERGFSGDGADARLAGSTVLTGLPLTRIANFSTSRIRITTGPTVHLPTGQITRVAGSHRLWPGSRDQSYRQSDRTAFTRAVDQPRGAKLAFPWPRAERGRYALFISAPGSSSVRVLHPAEGLCGYSPATAELADTGERP